MLSLIFEVFLLPGFWPNLIGVARWEGWGQTWKKNKAQPPAAITSSASCSFPSHELALTLSCDHFLTHKIKTFYSYPHCVSVRLWKHSTIKKYSYFLLKRWFIHLKKCMLTIGDIYILFVIFIFRVYYSESIQIKFSKAKRHMEWSPGGTQAQASSCLSHGVIQTVLSFPSNDV